MSAWFLSKCSKTVLKREFLLIPRARHRRWTHRLFSTQGGLHNSGKNNIDHVPLGKNFPDYVPLLTSIEERRREAQRSVLVQVKDHSSAEDLYQYCSTKYGPVQGLHFYKNTSSKIFANFFIVEFAHSDSVTKVLRQGLHSRDGSKQGGSPPVPVCSPFLWFSGTNSPRPKQKSPPPCGVPVHYTDLPSGSVATVAGLQSVGGLQDVSRQIEELWRSEAMTDVSSRIRFLVCRQIELAISGMFPFSSVLPFGSSVNSHGRHCCDLDMLLKLDGNTAEEEEEDSRLVFHAKGAVYGGERAQVQKYCDEISKIIQSFLPGCQDVQKVLNARVPIIKYNQQLAGLECDLTMSNSSGLHMSCLLHLWGHSDWRVRPLVATVRKWAKAQKLVLSVRPTQYFTNFTLTMLVVFYLQVEHRMLPTVAQLATLANPHDRYFLHDINKLKPHLNQCYDSSVSLEDLLSGFFQFYADFDFESLGLCVISGTVIAKHADWKNSSAMDITNPLEHDHNISHNINKSAANLFKEKCQDSLQKLEMLRDTKKGSGTLQKEGLLWLMSKERIPKGGRRHIKVADLGLLDQIETQETLPKNEKVIDVQKDVTKRKMNNVADTTPKPVKINELFRATESVEMKETVSNKVKDRTQIKINDMFKPKQKHKTSNKNSVKLDASGRDKSSLITDIEKSMTEEERIEYLKQSLKKCEIEISGEPETPETPRQPENIPQSEISKNPDTNLEKNKGSHLDFLKSF